MFSFTLTTTTLQWPHHLFVWRWKTTTDCPTYLYLYQDMPYDLLKSHLDTTTVVASLLFIFKQKQTMPFVRFLTLSMVTFFGLFPSTICGSWLSSPITSMRLFPFSSKCIVDPSFSTSIISEIKSFQSYPPDFRS